MFARQACGKLAASSFHGDFGAFVNLLQACTLVMTNLWQACCKLKLLSGEGLIPPRNANHNGNNIITALKHKRFLKSSEFQLKSLFKIWRAKWEGVGRKPKTTAETLKECDQSFFPMVAILQIFGRFL
ncbi:hypothetical protein AVEN_13061-1 [Araneus ventricosus]|uniref:Uncharacterized protein n=1 Tax=Araneus ventricosus TaxID=182803 RepID=A0A4Y2GPJ7_ARAVE|nr:hypothetical protein AVEN_13061-1 [Araneus ventricosus]